VKQPIVRKIFLPFAASPDGGASCACAAANAPAQNAATPNTAAAIRLFLIIALLLSADR
jgi:hypothetical protein